MTANLEADSPGDSIRNAAEAALTDVDALGLTGDDRSIMLKALLDARLRAAAPNMGMVPGVPTPVIPAAGTAATPTAPVAAGDVIGMLSAGLKVDRDTIELIYTEQDGEATLVVSPKKIAEGKALATKQLGQLVAAARQVTGLEEWTSVGTIRKVVTDYGRLDSGNFATTIQQMDSVALFRGKGQSREVKITKPGLEATADLIKSLAGTDS